MTDISLVVPASEGVCHRTVVALWLSIDTCASLDVASVPGRTWALL
ncbi:hypothetical protein ABT298_13775 [Streptomyces sp. NPDC001034]